MILRHWLYWVPVCSLAACSGNPTTDAASDATVMEASADAPSETSFDTGSDVIEASADAGTDAIDDVPVDTASDTAFDAGSDTGVLSGPCAPGSSCTRIGACLAETDNTGRTTPALRVDHVTFTAPLAFAGGLVATTISADVLPNNPPCNLNGSATTNWIFELGSGAMSLTIGAARDRSTAGTPFTLVDEMASIGGGMSIHVQPATTPISSSGGMLSSTAVDVVLPVYLDRAGTNAIYLPLLSVVTSFAIDPTNTCIGSYNAAGLDPASSCAPDSTHPSYLDRGRITGFVNLETADTVSVVATAQSLCVLLSGNASSYGSGSTPINRCRRDASGSIIFRGDWCSGTNSAATPTCADAIHMDGTFSASGVLVM